MQSGLKWTPLHIASFRGSVEVVKVILAAHVSAARACEHAPSGMHAPVPGSPLPRHTCTFTQRTRRRRLVQLLHQASSASAAIKMAPESLPGWLPALPFVGPPQVQCVNVTAADGSPMRRRDPRRQANSNRQLPYHVAVSRGHRHLTELLHPEVPYSFVLTPADLEATARLYGPAKLSVLAATALQHKLQADIERGMQVSNSCHRRMQFAVLPYHLQQESSMQEPFLG